MRSSVAPGNNGYKRILVLGYGNPGRQDDGLGPAAAEAIAAWEEPGIDVDADYQLNIEHGAQLAEYDTVLFIDASVSAPEPFELSRIAPSDTVAFTTHAVSPGSVLAITADHFGAPPEGWVLAIRGYEFEFMEALTPKAEENLAEALKCVHERLRAWREKSDGQQT